MIESVRGDLPDLERVVLLGTDDWEALAAGTEESAGLPDCQFDDPINIQYTSGTTGFPKGATLSHANILNNGYFVAEGCGYTEADRVCIPVPFYHCFGMVMGNLGCTTHGACMVIPEAAFDPEATLRAVQDERCTSLYGVPTMFIAELDHPDFATSTSPACAPGSWPARPARSRRCGASCTRCTWRRSRSVTA